MAKSAILSVLEDTIGRYVQGLDAKSLNVAVWAGKIELQSLQLDVLAVNRELARQAAEAPNLAIPFRIVDGSFDSLRVDVPWARITSKPVVLRAKGLEVTIEPFDHLNASATTANNNTNGEKKSSLKNKEKADSDGTGTGTISEGINEKKMSDERLHGLDLAEEARQRMNAIKQFGEMDDEDDNLSDQTRSSSSVGFKARLVRRVIENLQLEIEDINFQLKGAGCDIGASVDKFSIFTTDIVGNKSFIDRASNSKNVMKSFLYKALELQGLAVYCDEDRDHSASTYLKQPYNPMDDRYGKTYILSPLSFSARLRQSDCLQCVDFPKYLLSAELPTVSFRLTRTQLELVNRIGSEINEMKHVARPLFPEYRPDAPISRKTAKLWWKYAVRSIGRINRRRSWTEFFIAFQKRKLYIDLYKRSGYSDQCSWLRPINFSDRGELDQIELDKSISTQGVMVWRNMAEAQVQLEMRKYEEREESKRSAKISTPKKKSSFRSMLFGKKESDQADRSLLHDSSSGDTDMAIDDPLITLSAAEIRELESSLLESATADDGLSSDSILCDISFEMGSFNVDLVTFASAPLVTLEMGTVLTSFKANADGSLMSEFSLSSLDVRDRITRNSLFPVVIRSLQSSEQDADFETFKNAVEIKHSKARNGNQHLEAKMVSYEIVACDVLIKELKKFTTVSNQNGRKSTMQNNPMLQFSVTGGADLFYDADDAAENVGRTTVLTSAILQDIDELANSLVIQNNRETSKVRDKFSSAFADAWKSKSEKEIVWSVQIDLHAPILVLPKSCTDPMATTLVVDLGTFQMTYGKTLSPRVQNWFTTGSDLIHDDGDMKVDHCSLEMEHFSLVLSKAGRKDWLQARNADTPMMMESESIIDPVTLKLNIGLENGGKERKCMFGNLEQVSLTISHFQVVKAVSLLSFWSDTLRMLSTESDAKAGVEIVGEESEDPHSLSSPAKPKEPLLKVQQKLSRAYDMAHFSLTLEEFKAKIINERNESVEAFLVAATASTTKCSDDSSTLHLQMGHFWVLDHLKGDFTRKQRLVVHSLLPLPPSEYAEGDKYNVLESFASTSQNENEMTSLADIKIRKTSLGHNGMTMDNPFLLEDSELSMTTIDAKFSTLYLHWNPYAIKNLLVFQKDLMTLIESVKSIPLRSQRDGGVENSLDIPVEETFLVLNANMEAFEVCLNSAKDDLPLFGMTMANTSVFLHLHKDLEESMMASVAVGDFRLQALPTSDKMNLEYRTILGLSPNHSSSLLQLQYGKGSRALRCCPLDDFDMKENEMFMVVNLSPMTFIHCHAVVFTLMEYVTEGVLGALAEKVAESAVEAARQMSHSQTVGKKIFNVHAQGFDLLLPQAAYSPNYFILKAANLDIDFISLPAPGEGKTSIRLNEVTMKCNKGENIIADPIVLDVQISLAPLSSPTSHDMATKIDLDISRVGFVLSRNHYSQAMNTLNCNISEEDTYLRKDNCLERTVIRDEGESLNSISAKHLTHGGVEEVVLKKRMYMTFKFEAVCLDMCRDNTAEPLIAVAALHSEILLKLLPDEDQIEFTATMLDLVVEDRRIEAIGRHSKNIVQQVKRNNAEHDVFSVTYCKDKAKDITKIEVEFGSPRITFIPDALSDALSFFEAQELPPSTVEFDSAQETKVPLLGDLSNASEVQNNLKTLDFTLKTGDCSFVLIDMGAISGSSSQQSQFSAVDGETVVLKGRTSVSAKKVSNPSSGVLVELDCQVHGEDFEIYSSQSVFLSDPIQIMSPTKLSFFLSTKNIGDRSTTDVTLVSLADLDIILSVRQYALFMAIASSTTDTFANMVDSDSLVIEESLSENETEKINKLACALEKIDDNSSGGEMGVSRHSSSLSQSSHGTKNKKPRERVLKMKATLPNTNITVINDLQGVDEALFKVSISSFLNKTEVFLKEKKTDTIFHSHTYLLIHADYFDAHSKGWERLLLKPWELDFKVVRGKKKNTKRKATTVDIESHPCEISFSEQFIISLKSASAMWTVYSGANDKALALIKDMEETNERFVKSRASLAARSLTTTLPYGISNRCGIPVTYVVSDISSVVNDGSADSFRFPLSEGDGVGGYRLYGQYAQERKAISIIVADQQIIFNHIDDEIAKGKRAHNLGGGLYIFTEVKRTGKALILYIGSFMDIYNHTSLDFYTSLKINSQVNELGTNLGDGSFSQHSRIQRGDMKRMFGVNAILLQEAYGDSTNNRIWLTISPTKDNHLTGELELPPVAAYRQMAKKKSKAVEIVCSPRQSKKGHSITVSLECIVSLVDGRPLVELHLRPRLILRNNLYVNILAATPMQGTRSRNLAPNEEQGTWVHSLAPFDVIEVFHAGSTVAFAFKCADNQIGGNRTGWNKFGWIDIPLTLKSRLTDIINSSFPFLTSSGADSKFAGGCDFFLEEEGEPSKSDESSDWSDSRTRTISLSVNNVGVDHTGYILFESWDMNQQYAALDISESTGRQNFAFSSFSSPLYKRRITILPRADHFLRVIHLSMAGEDGFRRSGPFCIDDIAFCEGGLESSPILWEDSSESGYFAYRKLSSSNQSEVHIIPEFVIFNGGDSKVRITVQRCSDIVVENGKMAIASRPNSGEGLVLSIMFDEHKCASAPVQVEDLGLKVVLIRSCKSGSPVGSLAIQTVLGAKDSRFVVKLGALKHGNIVQDKGKSLISKDYLHFRIRWSQLEITLLDTSKAIGSNVREDSSNASLISHSGTSYQRVARFLLERFTIDYQKLFKEDAKVDAARTQFSAIVFNVQVSDCTKLEETLILSSVSNEHNFLDIRVRTRGSGDAGLAKIDLFELKIAHCGKTASKVIINTDEDFIWEILDIASRTNDAISEFSSTNTTVEYHSKSQSFRVQAVDIEEDDDDDDIEEDGTYRAPRSDMLFAVKKLYVWPSAFLVSFKRNPAAARYDQVQNVESAKIVAYFMKKLNFTVNKAHLRFAGFSCNNAKGPPDRIIQSVKAFYTSQMKKKLFILLASTSIDEWRQLSGRDDGNDSYVEGDILRTTGNLAGRSAGFIVKKVGQGIGQGFAAGTAEVGLGIQNVTEAIGIGALGAGVNSFVSGIGEGVGSTVEGVGSGGNKLIQGAGKGVGQIVGGMGGGLQQVAMGFGRGVRTGDGGAILTGFGDGVTSIGTGVVRGTESVVTGAAEGVFSIGKGLFTGVSSLGKGVGRAVQGKKPKKKVDPRKASSEKRS